MKKQTSPSNNARRPRLLFHALWALLFVKCLTLEYLVRNYAIPVGTIRYVWLPSIFMASLATIVNVPSSGAFPRREKLAELISLEKILFSATILAVTTGLFSSDESTHTFLAAAALLMALKGIYNYMSQRRSESLLSLATWLLSVPTLCLTSTSEAFLIFSVGIFVHAVLPWLQSFTKPSAPSYTG